MSFGVTNLALSLDSVSYICYIKQVTALNLLSCFVCVCMCLVGDGGLIGVCVCASHSVVSDSLRPHGL